MSRESSKQKNRQKIVQAAEQIIREDGVDRLTMRNLAGVAGVALKTPYNLFGSKTGVLIALLDQARDGLMSDFGQGLAGSHVLRLVISLDATRGFFESDETFYRAIFWEIMTSDQIEDRSLAHSQIFGLVIIRIEHAKREGEILQTTDVDELGRRLGLSLLAFLGMWAGGHLSIAECIEQTKMVWAALMRGVSTDEVAAEIGSGAIGT